MNQAHFSDLDDEIIADDWLVPGREISRRRLFKQTPKYNIYKADWFGDVLVYEPSTRALNSSKAASLRADKELLAERSRAEELRLRLANLDLNIHKPIPIRKPQSSLADSVDQVDSAYSSVSSTPHYHSKNLKSEFEFPQSPVSSSPSFSVVERAPTVAGQTKQIEQISNKVNSPRAPVILNKDSYLFNEQSDESPEQQQQQDNSGNNSTWQELNELRLIAHESFMLFMGASVSSGECCRGGSSSAVATANSSTSLVMQMNHPKAISLHDLLHRQHQQLKSPIDRFFTIRQYFGSAAKLNICQQIRDAMTYLHGKNIVHGRLTSVNIYIEPNQQVKISLIDNDERPLAASVLDGHDNHSVEFNAPALAYMSPELMRTLRVKPNQIGGGGGGSTLVKIDTDQLTKKFDIFSFGTIVYELFHERLPFEGLSAVEVIYRIGSGQTETIRGDCPALVQQTISACWSTNAEDRPDFRHLKFAKN